MQWLLLLYELEKELLELMDLLLNYSSHNLLELKFLSPSYFSDWKDSKILILEYELEEVVTLLKSMQSGKPFLKEWLLSIKSMWTKLKKER